MNFSRSGRCTKTGDYLICFQLRFRVKQKIKEEFNNYISNIETNIKFNPKKFWSYSKTLRQNSGIPNTVHYLDYVANDSVEVPNLFADYFKSVYVNSVNSVVNIHNVVSNCVTNLGSIHLDFDKILNELLSLDTSKGGGPDQIPTKFIKTCAFYLSEHLSILFNQSLKSGIFPDVWRVSHITPCYISICNRDVCETVKL